MLVTEDGPFDILRSLRRRLRAGEFGGDTLDAMRITPDELEAAMAAATQKRSLFGELLSCVYCTSIWVAAVVVATDYLFPIMRPLWLLLAVSAGAIFLHEILERIRR